MHPASDAARASATPATSNGVKGLLLTGWQPRFAGSRGGTYDDVRGRADGALELTTGAEYLRMLVKDPIGSERLGFFPLLPVRDLATTSALLDFSKYLVHADRRSQSCMHNHDDPIIAWMNVLQTLVFQLTKPAERRVTTQLLAVIRLVAQGIEELKSGDGATQAVMGHLREDPDAQDMLQRALSGLFGGRPLSQVERLRVVEKCLKRGVRHHRLLHDSVTSIAGLFAVLQVVPVVIGLVRGILSVDKAADHLDARRACLPGRLEAAAAAAPRALAPAAAETAATARLIAVVPAEAVAGSASAGGDDGGPWTLVCRKERKQHGAASSSSSSDSGESRGAARDKLRRVAIAELGRDAALLQNMARDSGLPGTSVDAFAELIQYCQRTDRAGNLVNLSRPADLADLGFVLHQS